jgi:hypothetical protein
MLNYKVIEYEEVVEVTEYTVVIEETVNVIEDTSPDYIDIWVDSFTQIEPLSGVDILWVIDPSGSMNDDGPRILNGINTMMNNLPPTGWRLNIIPTDYRYAEQQQLFPLIPGDTYADAEIMYNYAMQGAYEAGFDALYGYIVNNPYANSWLRSNAALLVVFVSDENEQSQTYFNSSNQFASWFQTLRTHTYMNSIVHYDVPTSLCNQVPNYTGTEYIDTTNYFNGVTIDICSEDWSQGVTNASNQVTPYHYFDLRKTPRDSNYIFVFIDGILNSDWSYSQQENRIYFNVIPPGNSLVEIAYYPQ